MWRERISKSGSRNVKGSLFSALGEEQPTNPNQKTSETYDWWMAAAEH